MRAELAHHIAQPLKIAFGGFKAKLCLVAAAMKSGNAGGVFKNAAAVLRLGADDLADLALADERLAACAGCGVGEQDLHIARPDIFCVDLVDGARLALNAAGDFEQIGIVEFGGRAAGTIVDGDADFGHVARGALVGPGKDDVIHGAAAHAFIGRLAHHPA